MIDVLLLRHAQSEWNAEGRWQGQANPPLSETGLEQVRRGAPDLPQIGFVASSEHSGISSVEVRAGLRERDVGAWSGLTNSEIDEQWPGDRASGRTPEGWEDDSAILVRVFQELTQIAALDTPGPVLVVTHGGVITLLEKHLGADRQPIANLEGRWISIDTAGAMTLGNRIALIR